MWTQFRYYGWNLLLAPGVVTHELGHAFFCWLSKTPIRKIKLFQFGNPAGYVEHAQPEKYYQAVLVAFGPLIVNSLLAMIFFAALKPPYWHYTNIIFAWLGLAASMHAIPSTGDARALWQTAKASFWKNPLAIVGWPFILVLHGLNWLKRWHLHFFYTLFLFWVGFVLLKAQ